VGVFVGWGREKSYKIVFESAYASPVCVSLVFGGKRGALAVHCLLDGRRVRAKVARVSGGRRSWPWLLSTRAEWW
jgi:hypothetical protein